MGRNGIGRKLRGDIDGRRACRASGGRRREDLRLVPLRFSVVRAERWIGIWASFAGPVYRILAWRAAGQAGKDHTQQQRLLHILGPLSIPNALPLPQSASRNSGQGWRELIVDPELHVDTGTG